MHDVTIENAIIRNFTYGIYAETSNSIGIRNNSLTSNAYDGIGIFYSTFTSVHDNTIERNEYDGIEVYNSSNNNIYGNYIAENVWYGMGLYEYSTGNITGNRIFGNYGGIELSLSSNNRIFHNDFINQTTQASTEFCTAKWDNDYPSGGNYWSNYNGNDIYSGPNQDQPGSDGIGDTNYTCTENNIDHYPLMNPWINIAVADVLPSKSNVGEGYKLYISVTVQNQGWNAQTTNLTVYVNTTVVGTIASLALPRRSQAILNFTWQTTPALRGNYVVSSTVDPIPNEPDVRDNNRTYERILKVTIVGDVNGDGTVDIFDAITLSNAFASVPNSPTWNGNVDINSDNSVDIFDAILLSGNFGKKI